MDGQPSTTARDFTLQLRLSNPPSLASGGSSAQWPVQSLTVASAATVLDVKGTIAASWPGRPKADGITLIHGGKLLRDSETVAELGVGQGQAVITVVIKPTAWTVPIEPHAVPLPASVATTPATEVPPPSLEPTVQAAAAATDRPYQPTYLTPVPEPAAAPVTVEEVPAILVSSPSGEGTPAPASEGAPTRPAPANPYGVYLAYLTQIIPLQRSLLLLNLQKAQGHYESLLDFIAESEPAQDEAEGETDRTVRELLEGCRLWDVVLDREKEAEKEYEEAAQKWEADRAGAGNEFQVVHVGGLPFMLHLPPSFALATPFPSPRIYAKQARYATIVHLLSTLTSLLMAYQPSAAPIAYGRQPARFTNTGTAAAGLPQVGVDGLPAARARAAAAAVGGAGPGAGGQVRTQTLSIVINLEAIVALLVPLLFLSVKLGFLFWIFARHASPNKRYVLAAACVAWVVWEGWAIMRRRAQRLQQAQAALGILPGREGALARARARVAGAGGAARRPAAAAGDDGAAGAPARAAAGQGVHGVMQPAPQQHDGAAAPAGPAPAPRRANGARSSASSRSSTRPPASRLTPKYWINWIAAFGMAEEARELGLVPRSIAGRPITNPSTSSSGGRSNSRTRRAAAGRTRFAALLRLRAQIRSAAWTALVALVLFVGTLSPEIEKKRRRALEKRDRLLVAKRAQRVAKLVELEQKKRAEAEAKEKADEDAEAERSGESSSRTEKGKGKAVNGGPASDEGSVTLAAFQAGLNGRAKVSDEELFRDGLGEPDQVSTHSHAGGHHHHRLNLDAAAVAGGAGTLAGAEMSTSTSAANSEPGSPLPERERDAAAPDGDGEGDNSLDATSDGESGEVDPAATGMADTDDEEDEDPEAVAERLDNEEGDDVDQIVALF